MFIPETTLLFAWFRVASWERSPISTQMSSQPRTRLQSRVHKLKSWQLLGHAHAATVEHCSPPAAPLSHCHGTGTRHRTWQVPSACAQSCSQAFCLGCVYWCTISAALHRRADQEQMGRPQVPVALPKVAQRQCT